MLFDTKKGSGCSSSYLSSTFLKPYINLESLISKAACVAHTNKLSKIVNGLRKIVVSIFLSSNIYRISYLNDPFAYL